MPRPTIDVQTDKGYSPVPDPLPVILLALMLVGIVFLLYHNL